MNISIDSLADLSAGAAFLATGGGGDPYLAYLTTCRALREFGAPRLIAPEDLPDDASVVAIGGVGAPTTSLELLPSLRDTVCALDGYQEATGRAVDAVVSFEIGGGNSMIPIVAAAAKGIAVIDGDGMGRALPAAQMMTYAIDGIRATPAIVCDYRGQVTRLDAATTTEYEQLVRRKAMQSGGMVTTVEFWMTGRQLKASVVPRTVSFSIEIGRLLRGRHGDAQQVAPLLAEAFKHSIYGEFRHLHSGLVTDVKTATVGGYDVGRATIDSLDAGSALVIDIKNEYLVATKGGIVLASVPDLITIVDLETAQPINAERLRYGQRVSVFAIGCPAYYRTEKALLAVGPRCFGFDFDFVPVERRAISGA